jgi:hypothetical protein
MLWGWQEWRQWEGGVATHFTSERQLGDNGETSCWGWGHSGRWRFRPSAQPWLALASVSYAFLVRVAQLAFPSLNCNLPGFFTRFSSFYVPTPWCHIFHFGANWLLIAKKKFTGRDWLMEGGYERASVLLPPGMWCDCRAYWFNAFHVSMQVGFINGCINNWTLGSRHVSLLLLNSLSFCRIFLGNWKRIPNSLGVI